MGKAGGMGLTDHLDTVRALARTGVLSPVRPDVAVRMAKEAGKWGQTAAAAVALSAHRHPRRLAIIDEAGRLTWADLERRTNALAAGLRERGVAAEGSVVGILARNHRGFVEALVAAAKLGADAVLLNTGFAGPQLAEVSRREGVNVLLHDPSFAPIVEESGLAGDAGTAVLPIWDDELLAGEADAPPLPAAGREGHVVILSSGTTGTPKGAKRDLSSGGKSRMSSLTSSLGMLRRLPLRGGETTVIAAPLFHTWGLSHALLCAVFGSPMVLRERFDPEETLAAVAGERAGALVAVPAMLQRVLTLPEEVRRRHDTSSLRLVALSGSALPGGLATRWMDAFGDNLFSLYGSTEVAVVALAQPADLRAAPDTAGPIVPGVDVRLLDAQGRAVAAGENGRIFVRSGLLFEGYTGGGNKEVIDGYMSTGDVGHFDTAGRLYVDGREDDMIVSGGENVFPQEVEEVILTMPSVADCAVVGVPDDGFGQRLRAVVVATDGASLTADEVRDHVRRNLARYKVPRDVLFRDELPRNTTGKVLRRELGDAEA
jgi:acyl-CoA synthetase (AMP-forming)/AMP-acid ligase II